MKRFFKNLVGGFATFGKQQTSSPPTRRARLFLEGLEDRFMPAVALGHFPVLIPAQTATIHQDLNNHPARVKIPSANAAVSTLDFTNGFTGSTSRLTYNGSATIQGGKAELTNGGRGEAASVFSSSKVDVTKFSTEFTFKLSPGAFTADGFTFTIQGMSPKAMGPGGGGLGYGPDHTGGIGGISKSVAIKFDLYNNQGEGVDSTGLYTNGAAPTNQGAINLAPSKIDLHSGHVFKVDMAYNGTTLAVKIQDTQTGNFATENYSINIPAKVGNMAYVGFTAGTGALTATQDILTWKYSSLGQIVTPPGNGPKAVQGLRAQLSPANSFPPADPRTHLVSATIDIINSLPSDRVGPFQLAFHLPTGFSVVGSTESINGHPVVIVAQNVPASSHSLAFGIPNGRLRIVVTFKVPPGFIGFAPVGTIDVLQ